MKSGVDRGEKVVSNGAFAVDAAAQLLGNYSMMNRPMVLFMKVSKGKIREVVSFLIGKNRTL